MITKFAKVIFLHVSVCPQGASTWAGTPTRAGTHPPGQVHTPPWQAHPQAGTAPPPGRYIFTTHK